MREHRRSSGSIPSSAREQGISTGVIPPLSSWGLCEQEGHLAAPSPSSICHCRSLLLIVVAFVAYWITSNKGMSVKQGYRLIIVDKAGVLVSEFQLTENALAQPEAFVAALKQSIDDIEEEEP